MGSSLPPRGFDHPVVFERRESCPYQQTEFLPGFRPAPEYYPEPLLRPWTQTAFSRFHSPTAPSLHREQPPPGLPPPGHVTSSPFRWAPTFSSLDDLPDMSQSGALTGFTLQSLPCQGPSRPLDPDSPLAIGPPCDWRSSLQGFECLGGWTGRARISPGGAPVWLSWVSSSLGLSPCPNSARAPFRTRISFLVLQESSRSGFQTLYSKVSKNR
jgi:hypothetical protein